MPFDDMDMLQDYEKDARLATQSYSLVETEVFDPDLRKIFQAAGTAAALSQKRFADLILKKGGRP